MTWAAAATAAYGMYQQDQNKNQGGSAGGSGGGSATPSSMSPSASTGTSTTVSPTFQQSFTPQISPVMQMSSGSGEQRASTSQVAPSGQSAQGGSGAPAYDESAGRSPSFLDTPTASSGFTPQVNYPPIDYSRFAPQDSGVFQTQGGGFPWLPVVAGVGALGALFLFMGGNNKKGRAK